MKNITLFYNPKCSKCRKALEILKNKNIEPELCFYLEGNLTKSQIKSILIGLNQSPRAIMRTDEKEYKEYGLSDNKLSSDNLINYILKYPKLLQRPILVIGDKAAIGRPPENILEIL